MNRSIVSTLSAVVVLAASAALIRGVDAKSTTPAVHASAQAPGAAVPKKAEEQFKNIQVLKGIPADQLIPTMQFISTSLGVECEFCHVQRAFEKDDKKPKQTARKMMEMMFAINKDNFNGHREVTCYSCHQGSTAPKAIPVVMTDEPSESTRASHTQAAPKPHEVTVPAGPSPDQLLEKFVQASGGAPTIDKITTRVMNGTIDFGGKSLPIEIYCKDPEKRISFTHMPEGDSVTAFNGQEGWLGSPGRPIHQMSGSDLDSAAMDADLHLPIHLKQMFTDLRLRDSEKIGDAEVYVVSGERRGSTPVNLYFDKNSGLLVRLVRYGDTALGWLPTQIDYADYRDANGVRVPYRWTLARPNGRFTIQVKDLQQNVPVDDAKFVKPPSPPEPSKSAN
jgi:photosynthetic reaction center cytochrome c subunit